MVPRFNEIKKTAITCMKTSLKYVFEIIFKANISYRIIWI